MTLKEFVANGRMVSDHCHYTVTDDPDDDLNRFDALLFDDGAAAVWDVRQDIITECKSYTHAVRAAAHLRRVARG